MPVRQPNTPAASRQPKGTPVGGQFAPSRLPEVDLVDKSKIQTPYGELAISTFANSEGKTVALLSILTQCCGASGKGLMNDETGEGYVGCRSCYEEVDSIHGDCYDETEFLDEARSQGIADYWFEGNLLTLAKARHQLTLKLASPPDE